MIISHYNKIERFEEIPTMDFNQALEKKQITILTEEIEQEYQSAIKSKMVNPKNVPRVWK